MTHRPPVAIYLASQSASVATVQYTLPGVGQGEGHVIQAN